MPLLYYKLIVSLVELLNNFLVHLLLQVGKLYSHGDNVLALKVIECEKLKWVTFFSFTLHVFIFTLFIRKVVFYYVTLCQVKAVGIYKSK